MPGRLASSVALLLEVSVKLIVRKMALIDVTGYLMLLHEILPASHGKETGKETTDTVPESFRLTKQVQKDILAVVHAGDMEVFSVSYVSGPIA
jgi:hypothetical protein